jgi:hypothetical protein
MASGLFDAQWGGRCASCRKKYQEGDHIGYVDDYDKPVCEKWSCSANEVRAVDRPAGDRIMPTMKRVLIAVVCVIGVLLLACTTPRRPSPSPTTTNPTTTPATTTAPPQACGGPITITTGGTYSGCYQSTNVNTPAVRISTTQPVTLSRARIIAKGNGVFGEGLPGIQLTTVDSVFEQTNPGAVVDHRAVYLDRPASFVFEHNQLTDTDGVLIHGSGLQVNPLIVNYNLAVNVGRYPHPTESNCCVQFLALDKVVTPAGQVQWNHTRNLPGQSGVEDNISLYISGGTDSTHRLDIGHNLIDGAYPITNNAEFTGGGINLGDNGSSHSFAHDNTVVSTTNYGIAVASDDNYATNNLLVNDGAEQASSFGQAIVAANVTPDGLHATGTRYNWHRSTTDATQYPCYQSVYCSGTAVTMTEQQARDAWEAARAGAGVIIGPRP